MSGAHIGAPREAWQHFDMVLGLGGNLLPCVPASPDVKVLPRSALEGKVGKIPSVLNEQGYALGLKAWQKRELLREERAVWARDGRYNMCVRTGSISGVYAIDVDIDDQQAAGAVFSTLAHLWPADAVMSLRTRSNSRKFLIPFEMRGDGCRKRIIETDHGRVELLGDGQQFVAAGTHSSGVPYEWAEGLPSALPALSFGQLNVIWDALAKSYGTKSSTTAVSTPSSGATEVLTAIAESDLKDLVQALKGLAPTAADNDRWSQIGYALLSLGAQGRDLFIRFSHDAPGYQPGAPETWWATHESQTPRSDYRHIFNLARAAGWKRTVLADAFPLQQPDPSTPVQLQRTAAGKPLSNVYNAAAMLAQQSVLMLTYDEFLQKMVVRWPDDVSPRPLGDEDITRARIALQGLGMEHLSTESTYQAVQLVARRNTVNCVADWLNGLKWDGQRRLSLLMLRAFGTPAERYYVRAGRNMLLAMVARALKPGCQVDEAVVLEGPQGSLKSSALRTIGGPYFAELTASPSGKDFEQQLLGVWLGEFAELNALRRTDDIARIKQFVTNRQDHIRLPYGRVYSDLPRRTVLCGSTNEQCWLHDPTGGRRFIPVEVGQIDLEWLRANREQLFAEAVALYKAGRKWWIYPKAETVAQQEARAPDDPWSASVWEYLCGRSEISDISAVLRWALGIEAERQNKTQATRVGVTLRQLGCKQLRQRRIDGRHCRPWTVPAELASRPMLIAGPVSFSPTPAANNLAPAANDVDATPQQVRAHGDLA